MTRLVAALGVVLALVSLSWAQSASRGGVGGGIATLLAGAGISINGATITNAGVTSLAAGSGNLTVSMSTGAVSVDMASAIAPTSVAIGSGTAITKMVVYAPSLTPSQISAAIGAVEQTFTVTGVTTADKIFVSPPSAPTALCPLASFRVSATNQIALTFANLAVALCTPTAGTYSILAIRS